METLSPQPIMMPSPTMTPQTVMMPQTNAPFSPSTLPPVNIAASSTLPPLDPTPMTNDVLDESTTLIETTIAPQDNTEERIELSTVEKMVIGVAIAITIILIGILVSVSTR